MFFARNLVRPQSKRALKSLEKNRTPHTVNDCLHHIGVIDQEGKTAYTTLVHPLLFNHFLHNCMFDEKEKAVEQVMQALKRSDKPSSKAPTVLYVKGETDVAVDELCRRQVRLIQKIHGNFICDNVQAANSVGEYLVKQQERGATVDEADIAIYRGLVEGLCAKDKAAAIALAVNVSLPPLGSACCAASVRLVDLNLETACTTFVEFFVEKDGEMPIGETCSTALAGHLFRHGKLDMLKLFLKYPVDPSALLLPGRKLFTSWCERHIGNNQRMNLKGRTEAAHHFIRARYPQPRQRTVDALSYWCLTDVGREWFQFGLSATASSPPATTSAATATDPLPPLVMEAWRQTCERIALQDPRKNLVEHRLLHTYAHFLRQGYITATDESFPYFLDECGESHSNAERPAEICFTLRRPVNGDALLGALRRLAPRSSYWCAVLDYYAEGNISCSLCPLDDIRVVVRLPPVHECNAAARASKTLLPLPVMFEDAHVVVFSKPAGLATSRHALSCTQLGYSTTDMIAEQLAGKRGEQLCSVFRQGQVHRLDTGTSGSIMMAKSNVAADSLRHQMGSSARLTYIPKIYRALCVVVESDLANVPLKGEIKDHGDARVQTQYRVIQFFNTSRTALVECRIQQGKKHQIRRHMASIGLPLCGDVEHGGAACCHPLMSRAALHAVSVSFIHPCTGAKTTVLSPVPSDFRNALEALQRQEKENKQKGKVTITTTGDKKASGYS